MTLEGEKPQDDAFASAFAAAAETGGALPSEGAPLPVVETPPAGETPPAVETPPAPTAAETPPAVETPPAGETPPTAETPPAPAAAETPPAPEAPPSVADDVVARLADVLKNNQPAPAPAAEASAAPAAEIPPVYNPQELQVLTDYEKNWPDVAQAETLRRRAEYQDLLKFVFEQVVEYTKPQFEQLRQIGNQLHMTELRGAVPDYSENLETEVAGWIDTQPAYLQAPFKQVMQTGTSDEVADLIRRYRETSGTTPAAQAPPSAAPAPAPKAPPKTELSNAAKQAAESLAPVGTDRTSVPQGEDPQDFTAAFRKYAAEMPG